jgi:transcriptional regulator with XRE-family HTH domain
MNYSIVDYVCEHAADWGIDPVATGRQLKKLRRQHNLTQEDLSGLFKDCRDGTASRVIISMWENGNKTPTLSHIVFLAKLYNCTIDELVVTYQRSTERDDRDQPVPLIAHISRRTYGVYICSSFLFCKPMVSVKHLSNRYNKIMDFQGDVSYKNLLSGCFLEKR